MHATEREANQQLASFTSVIYVQTICLNVPTTSYHHVLQQRGSKRGTREGGRSHSSVTLRRREEEEPTERRKRRQREQTQRGGSQAVHFLYSKKASSAHRGLCAPLRLFFFFYSFTLFPFLFLTKYSKAACERTTTLCPLQQAMSTPSKTSFCSSQATNTKGRKRLFFPSLKVREQVNAFHSTNMRNVSARP